MNIRPHFIYLCNRCHSWKWFKRVSFLHDVFTCAAEVDAGSRWEGAGRGSLFWAESTCDQQRSSCCFLFNFHLFERPTEINYIYQINFRGEKNVKLRFFGQWKSVDTKHTSYTLNINCFSINTCISPLKIIVCLKYKSFCKHWHLLYWEFIFYEQLLAPAAFFPEQLCPAGGPHSRSFFSEWKHLGQYWYKTSWTFFSCSSGSPL